MTNANDLIDSFNHTEATEGNFKGLTKREYFAAMAMQGVIAQLRGDIVTSKMQAEYYAKEYPNKTMFEAVALESVQLSDALITALNQTK